MRIKKLRKLTALLLCFLMLFSLVLPAGAAWDGYVEEIEDEKILIDMTKIGNVMNSGAVPSKKYKNQDNSYLAHWGNHVKLSSITFNKVERDWAGYTSVVFDIYSEKATTEKILLRVYTDYVKSEKISASFYVYTIKLDFEGWKHFEISKEDFTNTNSADWSKVNSARFIVNGTAASDADIYVTSVKGINADGSSGADDPVENMHLPEAEKNVAYKALGGGIAMMAFARNAIVDGKIIKLEEGDLVSTAGGENIASPTLLEKVLGAKISLEGDKVSFSLDGETADLTSIAKTYDDKVYLPIKRAVESVGKKCEEYDQFTIIGTEKDLERIKGSTGLSQKLKIMLNVTDLTESDVTKEDWKQIKDKWRKFLVGSEDKDLTDPDIIKKINLIDEDCKKTWEIFDRNTEILALFGKTPVTDTDDMQRHFENLYKMARAYGTSGSQYYQNEKLKADILFGLKWLNENLYGDDEINGTGWLGIREGNWNDWFVTVPHALGETMLIMEDSLTPVLIKKYFAPYDYLRTIIKKDLVVGDAASRCYGVTISAVLLEDFERMNNMLTDYNLLLKISQDPKAGVQEDWQYITHSAFAYSTVYGTGVLLDRLVRLESILSGTKFEMSTPYKYHSCKWLTETFEPLMFSGCLTNAQGGRNTGSESGYTITVIAAAVDLYGVFGKDDDENLKRIINRHVTDKNRSIIYNGLEINQVQKLNKILAEDYTDEGYIRNKLYYSGDSVMHHRDGFGFALSMSSSRIAKWESISSVNVRGWHRGDGMLYTYLDGEHDVYGSAFWSGVNPYHLPGTTADTQEHIPASIKSGQNPYGKEDFVGGAEMDGLYATVAMQLDDYNNDNKNGDVSTEYTGDAPYHQSSLKAKKAWFMFDDELVALGTDINAHDGFEVRTIVDNRLLTKKETVTKEGATGTGAQEYEVVSVTASDDDGNIPQNMLDSDYTTRWSAVYDQYAIFELEEAVPIGYVGIAQFSGVDGKQAIFELETSLDGINWTKVWEGKASGTTENMEAYDMKGTVAKYIKYSGHGRTNSAWNSVTEVKIYAPTVDGTMIVDEANSDDVILGANAITVDGNLMEKASTYTKNFTNPKWAHIEDYAGFYFPQGGDLVMNKVTTTSNFLEMWFTHGVSPQGGTYAYVTMPTKTAEETKAYSENPDIEILSNTEKLQAVREKTLGLTGMILWEKGSFEDINASEPMVVMSGKNGEEYKLNISDPTKLLLSATVTVSGDYETVKTDERCKVSSDGNNTVITVDFAGSKGRTLPVILKKK